METTNLRITGPLAHAADGRSEADLQKEARAYVEGAPGVRFLADVLVALHGGDGLRSPVGFCASFPPRQVLDALGRRLDLRVKLMSAVVGGPVALMRRLSAADLARQLDLLVVEDLPPTERGFRHEEDRSRAVNELYLKYLDPFDLVTYLPAQQIWDYESHDRWWTADPGRGQRALMLAEMKSVRRHQLLSDSEILDLLGDESLERGLPAEVRTRLRGAARKAAREGRPFKDSDLFACMRSPDGTRDLTEDLVESLSLATLRKVVGHVVRLLGLSDAGSTDAPAAREEAAAPPAPTARPPGPARPESSAPATAEPVSAAPRAASSPSNERPRVVPPAKDRAATPAPPAAARSSTPATPRGGNAQPKDQPFSTPPPPPGGRTRGTSGTQDAVNAFFGSGPPLEDEVLGPDDALAIPGDIAFEDSAETRR